VEIIEMKYGLFGIGSGICADPGIAVRITQAAEAAGYESVWTGEHVVLPDPQEPPSPAPPEMAMLHPSTIMAHLAAVTEEIKLGTGIVLIAQRNPVVLAKEIASLDVVCNGRLLFGIGAGYLHQEFAALGVEFSERGARTDEYVHAMRALWNMDKPAFKGKFVQFEGVQAFPRPKQIGGPPIVVGGSSKAALRRTVEYAQEWYGFAMNVEQTEKAVKELRALCDKAGRDWDLEISVTPGARLTTELRDQYASIGVDRLIPMIPQNSEPQLLDYVDALASEMGIRG
jgi:probable F420-dependent oxidoreductase